MKPILILAGAPVGWLDRSAVEVAGSIVDHRGPDGIIVVGAIELATAGRSHRVVDGRATTTVRLKDGTTIDSEAVGAVLNLVQALPAIGFRRSSERDRAYAEMELQALFVSFLRSFRCPVVNQVDGQGPLGVWSPLLWATLAHRCGIDTWPDGLSTGSRLLTPRTTPTEVPVAATNVTIVGERVFGAAVAWARRAVPSPGGGGGLRAARAHLRRGDRADAGGRPVPAARRRCRPWRLLGSCAVTPQLRRNGWRHDHRLRQW